MCVFTWQVARLCCKFRCDNANKYGMPLDGKTTREGRRDAMSACTHLVVDQNEPSRPLKHQHGPKTSAQARSLGRVQGLANERGRARPSHTHSERTNTHRTCPLPCRQVPVSQRGRARLSRRQLQQGMRPCGLHILQYRRGTARSRVCVCVCVCLRECMYAFMTMHACTHIHIYIHTCVYTHSTSVTDAASHP